MVQLVGAVMQCKDNSFEVKMLARDFCPRDQKDSPKKSPPVTPKRKWESIKS